MARRRIIDWQKVRRYLRKRVYKLKRRPRPLGWPVKLTWFSILAAADDFGLGEWSPAEISMIFMADEIEASEITIPEVAEIMATFAAGPDPSVLTWEQEGRTYFALPKYQNYQRTRSPSNADCPCPPLEVFAKLTPKTKGVIRANREKFTSIPEGLFCAEVEEEEEEEEEEEGAAGCSFCRKPTKGPLQHYHDEAKRVLGRCLVIPSRKAGPAIALLERERGRERCHALFAAYLNSQDPFVQKNGYSLMTFTSESIQNGLAEAVDKGYTHGKPGSRRQAANVGAAWRNR